MKFSYNWLQTFFDEKLQAPEKLAELFTFRFSEVESIEKVGNDTIFDLKILPDRACYALSHRGVAREISAICTMPLNISETHTYPAKDNSKLKITVEDFSSCSHYIGVLVEGVMVKESPRWLKDRLASVGQRSINVIVDIANFLMLDIGQPLHAFDADKVKGGIYVRKAKKGEAMTTLDDHDLVCDGSELIIADDEGALGVAGIKGGKRAAVTESTTRLILEAACFDPALLRKTSTRIGIRTDASKRFENRVPYSLQEETMKRFIALIQENQKNAASISAYVDVYRNVPREVTLNISAEFINQTLGSDLSVKSIEEIFSRLSIGFTKDSKEYTLAIPSWRLDLVIPEDIVEEVGRMSGYENLKSVLPPPEASPLPLKNQYWQEMIRSFLVREGFAEVITYSFRKNGVIEVVKSLASDKNYLRPNLTENIKEALEFNLTNAPLLGLERIALFEIGKIYTKNGEENSLAVGITQPKGAKGESVNEQIRAVRDRLVEALGAPVTTLCTIDDSGGIIVLSGQRIGTINNVDGIFELNLDKLIEVLPDASKWNFDSRTTEGEYKPISLYPFIVRDVAVYVEPGDEFKAIIEILNKLQKEGKLPNLLKLPEKPFDEFLNTKLNKKSFAFRLLFQSQERTLTDAEVNGEMEHIYGALKSKAGWVIR